MRTPEEIAKAEADGKEEEVAPDGHPEGKLYVQRAQSKAERQAELRDKFSGSAKEPSSKRQGVNLYVKNLEESSNEETLRTLFEPFGAITSVAAVTDDQGKCKGFGFVCFASPDEATKAVTEMHLKVVKGKPLYVGLAERRDTRQERLRQRYSPSAPGGMSGCGCGAKGGGKGEGGKSGKGGMMPSMYGGGPQGGFQGGMNPAMGMMGKGGPQMMGMMPPMMGMMPQAAMCGPRGQMGPRGPMMGMPGMGGMGGMGGMPGMNPQMMSMMGKGGPGMMPCGKGGPGMMGMPGMAGPMGAMGPMGMMKSPAQMMQMGGVRPGGPGGPGQPLPQPQQQQPPAAAVPAARGPLNAAALAAAPPSVQKQMIGEKIFIAISKIQPELAGKITGMMLEMDNSELLILLESEQQLKSKVEEALRVLESAKAG